MKAVLTYHSIDDSGSPISISAEAFADHHRWLASGRIKVLALDQLLEHPHDGGDAVAVTFDDGFVNMRDASERLLSDGVPVTVFVVSGHAGGTNAWAGQPQTGVPTLPLMDWLDLERLVARGAHVEAHTRNHLPLTLLSSDARDEELLGCRQDLEEHLGVRSDHVCYPYGAIDDAVAAHAGRCYRVGYSTVFSMLSPDDELLRIPRLDMYYFRGRGAIESWGTPAFRRRVRWCQWRRRARARLLGDGVPSA